MIGRKHYSECPVCGSRDINPLLTVKDHSVSLEDYVLWQCSHCTARFTQDVPDENSIGDYYKSENYISHTDSRKGFLNQAYQGVRAITLQQKVIQLVKYTGLQQGTVLDVGCGTGSFLNAIKAKGWKVQGLEPDADARALAKKLYDIDVQEPVAIHSLGDKTADAITLWHVLEHIHDLHEQLEQLKRILKPGGKLFVAVPNYHSLDSGAYKLHWAAYDVPRHLYHFSPRSMDMLMKQHKLSIVAKLPMWFDSFYVSILSSKYYKGKASYISALVNGLRSNMAAAANVDRCSSITYVIAST
ncbi:MAG TPA: class I SAM-dependent methyltransferase [Chitinophagaceae bacterium]|nr:class I SAM-dependent methyltransferase [Chitinophagaceae bacterium]